MSSEFRDRQFQMAVAFCVTQWALYVFYVVSISGCSTPAPRPAPLIHDARDIWGDESDDAVTHESWQAAYTPPTEYIERDIVPGMGRLLYPDAIDHPVHFEDRIGVPNWEGTVVRIGGGK